MGIRLLALTALACGTLAAPVAAATVDPLKPCYVSAGEEPQARENVPIAGTGFTPGESVLNYILVQNSHSQFFTYSSLYCFRRVAPHQDSRLMALLL